MDDEVMDEPEDMDEDADEGGVEDYFGMSPDWYASPPCPSSLWRMLKNSRLCVCFAPLQGRWGLSFSPTGLLSSSIVSLY